MKQIILSLLFALAALPAQALPTHSKITRAELESYALNRSQYNFEGIVKLSNCSGSIIRFEGSQPSDHAIVLTNGHCVATGPFGGMMKPGEFISGKAVRRTFQLLSPEGELTHNQVASTQVLYATMTGTDIGLYELGITYGELKAKYHVEAIVLERAHPVAAEPIEILSGYFQTGWACSIDTFIPELREGSYVMKDSIRYTKECTTGHGTSGSPIVSARTHRVVGINNTGNDNGEQCTMDNPCEVSAEGSISFQKGLKYGQETNRIYSCLDAANHLDLTVAGCELHHEKH
jgi:hypothetical protein